MPSTELLIQANTVPSSLCYTTPSTDWPILASYLRALFDGNELNVSATTPSADNRGKPWVRSNSDGSPDGIWQFYSGYWTQKHPLAPGTVIMWEGAQADIPTFDGGEVAAVTPLTGPFWEEVTAMAAKSPMHPGTLASGALVTVNTNLGEEKHTMTVTELATHSHDWATDDGQLVLAQVTANKVNDINRTGSLDYAYADPVKTTGDSTPFNVIHPCRGIWFLRRTNRIFLRRNP